VAATRGRRALAVALSATATALVAGSVEGPDWSVSWPAWPYALGAVAIWAVNLMILVVGLGDDPQPLTRVPTLSVLFAFAMTILGTGSYWATTQLNPTYRVGIERAAFFIAACTGVSLAAWWVLSRGAVRSTVQGRRLEWKWDRLSATTYLFFLVAALGTFVTLRRIGYVPILSGDPNSLRVEFPAIGGVWYRLSMLGGVVALLVGVQAAARKASLAHYLVGLASLAMVGAYGPRFFVALPMGVALLVWDRVRHALPIARFAGIALVGAVGFGLVGYWRQQEAGWAALGPLVLSLYVMLSEFRDLGWTLDYFGDGQHLLGGETLPSAIVPLLPAAVWALVGIDKGGIYANDSATILGRLMGETVGIRVGIYGEWFMNFGWAGALSAAALYGTIIAALDRACQTVRVGEVRTVVLYLIVATALFAQIGQLNMFTSTLTSYGYPLGLAALISSVRQG